jgi:hypothetical protein
MKQRCKLSKQLQDLHADVALLSETPLKSHGRFFISIYQFNRTNRHQGRKGGTTLAIRRGVLHNHVVLQPLISVEGTGVCIPIVNNEVLLASVYITPDPAWSDADITEILSFRVKSILAGDLTAKLPF